MGWAERRAAEARAVVEGKGASVAELPHVPQDEALGASASPWHEATCRAMIVGLLRQRAELQQYAARPRLVGADGRVQGPDPAMVLVNVVAEMSLAQAMTLDLVLGFLTGRPELRPAGAAPNGKASVPEAEPEK